MLLEEFSSFKVGIECSGYTLEQIAAIDELWVRDLRRWWEEGRCEFIGSGYAQSILPLIPASANQKNLELGQIAYQKILARRPETAYVNEQTYSGGLVSLYKQAGFSRLIMDWNNPYKYHHFPKEWRYQPQMIQGFDGAELALVWNNSIAFQKFQRYAHGELTLDQVMAFLLSHWSPDETRAFPLYGNDAEVFDYRPGNDGVGPNKGEEFDRIRRLLEVLSADGRVAFATPAEVAALLQPQAPKLRLESPEWPIPTKKQERYNVTRWAVTGRDGARLNSQCQQLHQALEGLEGMSHCLECPVDSLPLWRDLCALWGSDYRTHTTDAKYEAFARRLGDVWGGIGRSRSGLIERIPLEGDFALMNVLPIPWIGEPCRLPLRFGPGVVEADIVLEVDGQEVPTQVEEPQRYRDGSLRQALVSFCPRLAPGAIAQCRVRSVRGASLLRRAEWGGATIDTPALTVQLLPSKGGTLSAVTFKQVSTVPLCGWVPHGYFEDIAYGVDWFTGDVVLVQKNGRQVTDLAQSTIEWPDGGAWPIAVPVRVKTVTPIGEIIKTYRFYQAVPRVDVIYDFRWRDIEPLSLRAGIVTALPTAFAQASAFYATVNGGTTIEQFALNGHAVTHGQAVNSLITARHGLGATEGWVSMGDADKGVATILRKYHTYAIPMVEYRELDEGLFFQITHSLGETDETARTFWRGHSRFSLTLLAHRNDLGSVRTRSRMINQGLILRDGGEQARVRLAHEASL
ncbi:MAG: hypothetical protein KGN30_09910 [Nitrospirota bacterium]|nr:hypothetical protein [Nitrospirota bacterium]